MSRSKHESRSGRILNPLASPPQKHELAVICPIAGLRTASFASWHVVKKVLTLYVILERARFRCRTPWHTGGRLAVTNITLLDMVGTDIRLNTSRYCSAGTNKGSSQARPRLRFQALCEGHQVTKNRSCFTCVGDKHPAIRHPTLLFLPCNAFAGDCPCKHLCWV